MSHEKKTWLVGLYRGFLILYYQVTVGFFHKPMTFQDPVFKETQDDTWESHGFWWLRYRSLKKQNMWKFIKFKKAGRVAWMASWFQNRQQGGKWRRLSERTNGVCVCVFFFRWLGPCDRFIGKMVGCVFFLGDFLRIESLNMFAMDILNLAVLCDLFGMVKWSFHRLSDLQLGDRKVTLNHLECNF